MAKILTCDNSMIELRMAAWLANEEHMLELFREGADLHKATAAYVSIALPKYKMPMREFWPRRDEFMPLVTHEFRSRAKPVNFGFLFWQQAMGFIDYARVQYGVYFSMEEALLAYQGFHEMWPDLQRLKERAEVWLARGWCITPFGWVRHHLQTLNEAIATPVQSSASTLLSLAGIAAKRETDKKQLDIKYFAEIHDSIQCRGDGDDIITAGDIIKKHMERPPTEWLGVNFNDITVPLKADLSITNSWDEAEYDEWKEKHLDLFK